ncbi:hypothetical protein Hanom_Chr06g00499771 [Helianthus anomalus]
MKVYSTSPTGNRQFKIKNGQTDLNPTGSMSCSQSNFVYHHKHLNNHKKKKKKPVV